MWQDREVDNIEHRSEDADDQGGVAMDREVGALRDASHTLIQHIHLIILFRLKKKVNFESSTAIICKP